MTVRELISLNQMITDLQITVRKDGKLLDQLNIGCSEGVKPPYPTRVPKDERYIDSMGYYSHTHREATYIDKSINAFDDGRDYWQVKPERLPKQWLELEVTSWDSHPASRVHTTSPRRCNTNFYGELIRIETIPSGQSLEIVQKVEKAAEVEEEDGENQQLPLTFWED